MSKIEGCYICRKQSGKEEQPPGGYIYEGHHFAVCHAPLDMGSNCTILVESKRHFLDFGDIRQNEGAELTEILKRLFPIMKKVAKAERVYSVATMDGAPHFHLWLVPWKKGERLRGVRYLATGKKAPTLREVREIVRLIRRGILSKPAVAGLSSSKG